jgi:hypothetical protein
MARKQKKSKASFEMFNVVYEDGSLSSNRRISSDLLSDPFHTDPMDLARQAIEEQDEEIAQRSGKPRLEIKSIKKA